MGGEPTSMTPSNDETVQPRTNNARRRELEKVFL
jgi:hypothetical protein